MASSRLSIDSGAFLLFAMLLLLLPVKWIAGFILAAVWHESCHYAALSVAGIPVRGIRISMGGMVMDIPELSQRVECICALAGPVGGLLLLICYRWFPEACLCALVQSIYNMIPVYPLDGGRVFRCTVGWLCPRYSDRICTVVEMVTLVCILLFGTAFHWGIVSLFAICLLVGKLLRGKIPCKLYKLRVQ